MICQEEALFTKRLHDKNIPPEKITPANLNSLNKNAVPTPGFEKIRSWPAKAPPVLTRLDIILRSSLAFTH